MDLKTIDKISKLAKIHLNDTEKEWYLSQLNQILNYVEVLAELDTQNVAEFRSAHLFQTQYRKDQKEKNINLPGNQNDFQEYQNDFLTNAPLSKNKCVVVPLVIDQE